MLSPLSCFLYIRIIKIDKHSLILFFIFSQHNQVKEEHARDLTIYEYRKIHCLSSFTFVSMAVWCWHCWSLAFQTWWLLKEPFLHNFDRLLTILVILLKRQLSASLKSSWEENEHSAIDSFFSSSLVVVVSTFLMCLSSRETEMP